MNPNLKGTKAGAWYRIADVPAGGTVVIRSRLYQEDEKPQHDELFGSAFENLFDQRRREADEFYATVHKEQINEEEKQIARQACAGLMWSKQFYHYIVRDWIGGDR